MTLGSSNNIGSGGVKDGNSGKRYSDGISNMKINNNYNNNITTISNISNNKSTIT